MHNKLCCYLCYQWIVKYLLPHNQECTKCKVYTREQALEYLDKLVSWTNVSFEFYSTSQCLCLLYYILFELRIDINSLNIQFSYTPLPFLWWFPDLNAYLWSWSSLSKYVDILPLFFVIPVLFCAVLEINSVREHLAVILNLY